MSMNVSTILNLVGKLDDSPGPNAPRERFRNFLKNNVKQLSILRDYIEECLRNTDDQYNRAFQDLVNHLGSFMGFEVEFGRYQGTQEEIGFDGLWKSPTGFYIVIETKKTETYTIKTSQLLGYINELISEKKISDPDQVLGLYVIGMPSKEATQLEKAIIADKQTNKLRVVSIDSLLSLAELMNQYDINHDDILTIIKPSGPRIDPIVEMITHLVAEKSEIKEETENKTQESVEERQYWMAPVKEEEEQTAEEVIKSLVVENKIYALGERTPGRTKIKPGDFICFYACRKGIVVHAEVASFPEKKPHPKVSHPDLYPWTIKLKNVKEYFDKPIVIDAELRSKLEAFSKSDPKRPWAWFVKATRKVSKKDFMTLTNSSLEIR